MLQDVLFEPGRYKLFVNLRSIEFTIGYADRGVSIAELNASVRYQEARKVGTR